MPTCPRPGMLMLFSTVLYSIWMWESSAEPYVVSNIKYIPKQCYQCVTVVNEQNQVVTKKESAETQYCIAANRKLLSQNVTTCRRNETCTVYLTRIGTGMNNGTTPPARGYQCELIFM